MPTFVYSGKTASGEMRKGEMQAANLARATASLRRQHILPSSISQKKAWFSLSIINIPGFGQKVTTKDLVIFSRQFATMIDAGLPLVQCLDILASQQENAEFKKVLIDVKSSVEEARPSPAP